MFLCPPKYQRCFHIPLLQGEMSVQNLSLKQIRTSQISTRRTSSELQSDMKICPETECPFFTKAVSGAGVAVTKQSLQHQAHYYIINFKKTKQCGHRDAAEFHQGVFLLCVSWQRHKTSSRERCTHSGV